MPDVILPVLDERRAIEIGIGDETREQFLAETGVVGAALVVAVNVVVGDVIAGADGDRGQQAQKRRQEEDEDHRGLILRP